MDTFQDVLDRLASNNGAVLYWQMPDVERGQAALRAGVVGECDDLLIHPEAIELQKGMAYEMPPAMQIMYLADECDPSRMTLRELLGNFIDSEAKVWPSDILAELQSRGWYEGLHDNGRFCILNLEKLGLK